jgi:hypothetical protein
MDTKTYIVKKAITILLLLGVFALAAFRQYILPIPSASASVHESADGGATLDPVRDEGPAQRSLGEAADEQD